MKRSMKVVSNVSKKNNWGFTIMELIVAIAILGIISVTVGVVMVTSSRSYRSMSVETQLQSEAQMVANYISELAIDSYDAVVDMSDTAVADLGIDSAYDDASDNNDVLVLCSKEEGVEKQYIIVLKKATQELYMAERTNSGSGWDKTALADTDYSLLGSNITSLNIDDSKVVGDNVLMYSFKYERDGRAYEGQYQVLMRNRAYADQEPTGNNTGTGTSLVIGLNKKVVYLDVKNSNPDPEKGLDTTIDYYYENSVADGNKYGAALGVEFEATATSNRPLSNRGVSWELVGADPAVFYLSEGERQEGTDQVGINTLRWHEDALADSVIDSFTLKISKSISDADGSGTISAQSKNASILLRRVRKIDLNASTGAAQWNSQYTDEFGGVSDSRANGYAYPGKDGGYVNMTINATIEQSNVAYGGGLDWELYKYDNSTDDWGDCTASYAHLLVSESETGTSTQIEFGSALENGQLYKVVARSKFDPTVSGEYIFGVVPTGAGSESGFNSRGFYVDLTSYVKRQEGYELVSIAGMRKGAVSGIFGDGSDIRVEKRLDGRWYLYVSYDAHSGKAADKSKFYSDSGEIEIYVTRTDAAKEDPEPIKYVVSPVEVDKITPRNNIIVLQKGKSEQVTVKASFYNVIGRRYFGIYLDDMTTNLNASSGMADTNDFIRANVISSYGDEFNYVEKVTTELTAKTSVRDYATGPMVLRLTADDYYACAEPGDESPYEDYMVYMANVEGVEAFIPTPDTKEGDCTWPATGVGSTKKDVNTFDADGNLYAGFAEVYVENNSYKCDYMGTTYTYNKTYHYWYK